MSEARDQIFAALRAASQTANLNYSSHAHPRGNIDASPLPWPEMPSNAIDVFRERVEQAGGAFEIAEEQQGPLGLGWPIPLDEAEHVFSEYAALPSRGLGRNVAQESTEPSHFRNESLRELAPLDFCVLRGAFGVVENGAVWHIPTSPAVRAAALLAEHLVLVVDSTSLVPTLHQAYDRIDLRGAPFGWFLCGPSKTADIEQALVFGAHGPKTMRLVLQGNAQPR